MSRRNSSGRRAANAALTKPRVPAQVWALQQGEVERSERWWQAGNAALAKPRVPAAKGRAGCSESGLHVAREHGGSAALAHPRVPARSKTVRQRAPCKHRHMHAGCRLTAAPHAPPVPNECLLSTCSSPRGVCRSQALEPRNLAMLAVMHNATRAAAQPLQSELGTTRLTKGVAERGCLRQPPTRRQQQQV